MVGLTQMRGVNEPNEKSDSSDSVQHNPQSMAEVARNETRDTEERPFRMLKVIIIETRGIPRLCLSLGRKGKKDLFEY